MDKQSDRYLEETLMQAKKFGLDSHYIQQLEAHLHQRWEKNKAFEEE